MDHASGDAGGGPHAPTLLMEPTLRVLAVAAMLVAAAPRAAPAQTWRLLTSSRQVHGESALDVEVRYGAGRFTLLPAAAGTLYRMELRYDEEHARPLREYDAAAARLRLGTESRGRGARVSRSRGAEPPYLNLALTPDVPLRLNLELGAVQAEVDLGGLALRALTYRTGASVTQLRFSRPNPERCDRMTLVAGAAEFRVTGLGYSNCAHLEFDGGVGEVVLDFDGLSQSMQGEIDVGLGSLTLRIPREAGVTIRLSRFLASFAAAGFTRRGAHYVSEGYDRARYRIDLDVNATIGEVNVVWIARR